MIHASSTKPLLINEPRLLADLERLSQFGLNAAGGIDRASFSTADGEARNWLIGRCEEAGLHTEVDGIGNILVSSPVLESGIMNRTAVWTGSHIDAVPNGGKFDGPLGSLAALECLRRLHEERVPLLRPVRVIIYADEEGNYGHLLGSSAISRGIRIEELSRLIGRDGDRFADTFQAAGGDLKAAAKVKWEPGSVHAFVELHIEQGPVLEQSKVQVGVVTGIVAIGGGTLRFLGQADHAGTTPMHARKDAVVAAAEFIVALPALASSVSPEAVVTTGIVRVEPSGSNVIAGVGEVVVDYRDPTLEGARLLEHRIMTAAKDIAARRVVEVAIDWEEIVPDAPMDEAIRSVIFDTANALGLSAMSIPSGAGHDSQNMATLGPAGMIFVPSVGGRSHSPAEHTHSPDVVRGANVLLGTVIRLAT